MIIEARRLSTARRGSVPATEKPPQTDRAGDDTLPTRLQRQRGALCSRLIEQLSSGKTPRYRGTRRALLAQRVDALVGALCAALEEGQVMRFVSHVEALAVERRAEGFELAEVQLALNLLQAEAWREITSGGAASQQAEELRRLTATVGAAKDLLARSYLRDARRADEQLEVGALFRGTDSGPDTGE